MKKIFTPLNIQAFLLFLLSIADTVVMILFKPLSLKIILLMQLISILSIVEIRFAPQMAFWKNRRNSRWNRKYSDNEYDQPSDFAIDIIKIVGYIFLFLMQLVLFL